MLFLPYRQHCDPYSASIMGENVAEMCSFLAYGLLLLPIILHLSTFYMVLKRVKPTQIGLKMDNNIFAGGQLLLSILLPTILNMMVQLGSLTSFFLSILCKIWPKQKSGRDVQHFCSWPTTAHSCPTNFFYDGASCLVSPISPLNHLQSKIWPEISTK